MWYLVLLIHLPNHKLSVTDVGAVPTLQACLDKGNTTIKAMKPQQANFVCEEVK